MRTRSIILTLWVVLLFNSGTNAEQKLAPNDVTVNVPSASEEAGGPIMGAYYYPWYGVGLGPLENDWKALLRHKLVPTQTPKLGSYRSSDPAIIAEHIRQSQQAGLAFWALSWWGPDSATDKTIRQSILAHPNANKLRYAVLYESTGRLGKLDAPNYDKLADDFAHLAEHYFSNPLYLRIKNRPVVFIYLSRVYFRDQGLDELAEVRRRFPEVYIVGDDVFGEGYRAEWAENFDAVTAYDVYGQSTGLYGATDEAVKYLAQNYSKARSGANSVGTAFMPTVAPGYNDRGVREGHPGTARYIKGKINQEEGSLFRAMIRKAALPNLDATCGKLMLVTSFNEWYEDSQIEPTSGTAGTTATDTSKTKEYFTGGDAYSDYGDLYLNILSEEIRTKP